MVRRRKRLSLKATVREISKAERLAQSLKRGATPKQKKQLNLHVKHLKTLKSRAMSMPGHREFFLVVDK